MNQAIVLDFLIIFVYISMIAIMYKKLSKNWDPNPDVSSKMTKECKTAVNDLRNASPTSYVSLVTGFVGGLLTYVIVRTLSSINTKNVIGISILSSVLIFFFSYKAINCWQARTLG